MSVELLKLTSASLPSSGKPVPRICKPTAPTLPVQKFDNTIFSPLPTSEAAEGTCVNRQIDSVAEEPPLFHRPPTDPSFSPITVKASDNFALFGTPTASSPAASNYESASSEGQSSVLSILSSNTSTPNSIQVKILSSKLKEIPSPHSQTNQDKCNSPPGACMQTPPRALGIPASKKNYENHGGLHLKPNSRSTKPVKKVLSQGVMSTGLVGLDESSPDDSIIVVNVNSTKQTSIKDKLCQKKGSSSHKHVVYPNVLQHKGEDKAFTKEAKGIQTDFPEKFDEGTQCEEDKVIVHTRGIQTSPNSSMAKKQHPVQNLPPPAVATTTPLTQSITPQLTDAVTLIASTAAAAAVAASASLHSNDKHPKEPCLNTRNDSRDSQKYLQDISTNTRTGFVHTATQTTRTDHQSDLSKPGTTNKTKLETSPKTNHNIVDSQINKRAQATFDPRSVKRDSHWLRRSELLKQKYEKSSVDGVVEVLHSVAVAQEEIEHQCAALESTPTLTEFTEAMIKGRAIQEQIRIHQSVNKLIEQAKAKENQLAPDLDPAISKEHGSSLKTKGGRSLQTRQAAKSSQKVAKIRKRKADSHVENYHRHVYGSKSDYRADAERTPHKAEFVVNPLWHDIGCQMNSANPRLAAIPLGPPRQSKSHHSIPTASMASTFKSVACQAPSNMATPVKHAKEKPDTSTGSIKLTSPVNTSSSNGTMEATVLSSGKPSPTAAPTGRDDVPRDDNFQQVLDICSYSSTNNSDVAFEDNKETEGTAITVEGEEVQRAADYQGPSFPPKPAERLSPYNVEPLSMSASDLDKKLRENLEQKAMEWIHQELLVRLAAEKSQDPVGHTVNTCSTCSTNSATEDFPGMHKLPKDEEDECVKVLVYEEVLGLIKKVLKEKSCKKEKESLKESEVSEVDDASSNASALCHLLTPVVTPPSTPTNLRSTTSSPDHVTLVTTPLPTPLQSPTPSIGELVEITSVQSEVSRIPTPKSSSSSASNDDINDSLMHSVQPEIVNSNLSSPNTTQPTITTSVHTPEASSESANQKPQTEEAVTGHTIDPAATSAESSSTTSSSPAVSDATSSSTTTTDHDISMGEYILAKPTVVQRAKKPDYSLSEGEVPLSPGDARWNALHASNLTGNLKEKRKKDITRPNHPVVEAFLDLKQAISCEKDSDSATEFSADSLQFKPQVSNGELQAGSRDPFKKLLDKLNSSNSSSNSTTAGGDEEKDNTLSEVTSFATQEDITTTISSPPPGGTTAAVTDDIGNGTSPGEIARNISVLPVPPGEEPSMGEVNSSQKVAKMSRSPGEVPPILRASETRHGIDVIRISKWSDKPPPNDNIQQPSVAMTSESQYLMEQFDSSEIIQMSTSRSSMHTQSYSNSSSQPQPVVSHTNANDGPTESQVLSSSPTKSHTVEGEVNRKVVTINIPDTTAGFYSEDTSSNKELSTEMTFTISSLSSENF